MEPDIQHYFADNLYAKQAQIPAGLRLGKHTHTYTHLSILAKGAVYVYVDDIRHYYEAPACIEIKANLVHEVEALTDVTWYCVHATDETDETKVDEVLIQQGK
jgi:quercetin dioxygenase-like cupin family protein